MAMTRKQAKWFVQDINNWRIIPGNQYVQIALLDFKDLHIATIQYRVDINHWMKYVMHSDYKEEIIWRSGSLWSYDPYSETLLNGISMTEVVNMIYERDHADVLIEGLGGKK